jgi:hypothetical protein
MSGQKERSQEKMGLMSKERMRREKMKLDGIMRVRMRCEEPSVTTDEDGSDNEPEGLAAGRERLADEEGP